MRASRWVSLGLCLGCAGPQASKGLLEGPLPLETLSEPDDIGVDGLSFSTGASVLPSGLRIAHERAATRGMVGVVLTIGAGAAADPPGKEGLAHYVEHLTFRARPRGRELAHELGALGATFNAATSLDETTYYEFEPEAALPALLRIAAGRLQAPLASVEGGAAAVELDIVRSEIALRNETGAYGQVLNWVRAALVDGAHPYSRAVGGDAASLGRITLEDARRFVAARYRPENATLLVIGDLDQARLSALVAEAFPPALRGEPGQQVAPARPEVKPVSAELPVAPAAPPRHQAAVSTPEIWIGYLLPGRFSRRAGIVRLVASDATERALRAELGADEDVIEVAVVPIHLRHASVLAVHLALSSPRRRDAIAATALDVVGDLWRPLPMQKAQARAAGAPRLPVETGGGLTVHVAPGPELFMRLHRTRVARMRNEAIADAIAALEPFTGRVLERAQYLHAIGTDTALSAAMRQTIEADEASISTLAEQFLAPARARVVYVDPLPAERRPRPGVVGVTDRPITDERATAVDLGPPAVAPAPPELAAAWRVRLDNGLEVVIVPRPQYPVVAAALAFRGGAATADPPGVVDLLRRLERRSTSTEHALELVPVDGPTFTADVVRTGRRNLSNALLRLAGRVVASDRTGWEALLDPANREPIVFRLYPEEKAERLLRSALYGGHPLGRAVEGPELLELRAAHVQGWLPRMRSPHNALLVIAGDVEADAAERLAPRGWFGSWRGVPAAARPELPPLPPPPTGGALDRPPPIVARAGDAQSRLVLACRLPPAEARARHDLLAAALEGELTSMVRHRAGAAYSVDGEVERLPGGAAALHFTMELDTRRLPEALAAVRALWRRLGERGYEGGAVSQARWSVAASHNLRLQTAGELAVAVVRDWSLGRPLEERARYPQELLAVDEAELAAAFAACRQSTATVVLGDKAALERALAGPR